MLRLMGNPGRRYATGTRPFSLVDPVMDRRALERIASVNFICVGREGRNQNASLERTIWLKKKKKSIRHSVLGLCTIQVKDPGHSECMLI